MVEEILDSPINTIVNIITLSLFFIIGIICYYIFSKILKIGGIESPNAVLKRRLVIGFTSLVFATSIMLSIIMTVTAIAKNMLLTANELFPNIDYNMFHQIFPNYNETTVRAFIFSNFIPIVRTCILLFGPLYFFIELNFWGAQQDWINAPPHIQLLRNIFNLKQVQIKKQRWICFLLSVFFIVILPLSFFYFVITIDTGFPFKFFGAYNGIADAYFYFSPFLTEVIASYYLSNYSVIKITEYLRPSLILSNNITNTLIKRNFLSKFGYQSLKLLGFYYLIQIIISFIRMILVFMNFGTEEIIRNWTIFTFLLNFYPNSISLQILDNFFTIFPIDFLLAWLLGFIFALKELFNRIIGKQRQLKPRDLFFFCFIISGFITLLAYRFMVYYPWMYATSITGSIFNFYTGIAEKYYPKIVAEKIFSFFFIIQYLGIKKNKKQ